MKIHSDGKQKILIMRKTYKIVLIDWLIFIFIAQIFYSYKLNLQLSRARIDQWQKEGWVTNLVYAPPVSYSAEVVKALGWEQLAQQEGQDTTSPWQPDHWTSAASHTRCRSGQMLLAPSAMPGFEARGWLRIPIE